MKALPVKVFVSFFLISWIATSQVNTKVYNSIDKLVAFPNTKNLTLFEKKIEHFILVSKTKNDFLSIAIGYCNLGFYKKNIGLIGQAINAYEKAIQLNTTYNFKNYNFTKNAQFPLTKLYIQQGDFSKAVLTIRNVIHNTQSNPEQKIKAILLLSTIYHSTGNYKSANSILTEAEEKSQNLPLLRDQILNNIASNYIALGFYNKAESTLKKISVKNRNTNFYKNFALLSIKQNRLMAASLYFTKAKEQLQKEKPSLRKIVQTDIEEAQLWVSQRKLKKAKAILDRTAKNYFAKECSNLTVNDIFSDPILIELFTTYAQVSPDKALYFYELSIAVYDRLLNQFYSPKTQITHQSARKNNLENCIELIYEKYQQTADSTLIKKGLLYIEKSKSNQLTQRVLKQNLLKKFPTDNDLILEKNLITKQKKELQILTHQTQNTPSFINQIKETEHLLAKVQNKLQLKYPSVYQNEINFNSFISKLNSQKAGVISFFYGKKYLYYIYLNNGMYFFNRIKLNPSFTQLLSAFIHQFDTASVINNDIYKYQEIAHKLFNAFDLPKINGRLLIIPDGILNFVPFDALLTQKSNTSNFENMPFLLNTASIVYNNSIRQFVSKNNLQPSKNLKLLGVFPVFKNTSNYLKYAIEESKSIQPYFESKMLINEASTKTNFMKQSENYDILHLCTHAKGGTFSEEGSIKFYDEDLFISELVTLNLNTELVILSACETGIGSIIKGQAPNSIANGFQAVGVKNMMYTLWEINDQSTSKLIHFFYKNYSKTKSISFSNHKAKLDYLSNKKVSSLRKSPYYWASFVYYGDFQDQGISYFNTTWTIVLIGLILLSTITIFIFLKKKKWL